MAVLGDGRQVRVTRGDQGDRGSGWGCSGPAWHSLLTTATSRGWVPAGARRLVRPTRWNIRGYTPWETGDVIAGGDLSGYSSGARICPEDCRSLSEALAGVSGSEWVRRILQRAPLPASASTWRSWDRRTIMNQSERIEAAALRAVHLEDAARAAQQAAATARAEYVRLSNSGGAPRPAVLPRYNAAPVASYGTIRLEDATATAEQRFLDRQLAAVALARADGEDDTASLDADDNAGANLAGWERRFLERQRAAVKSL